MGTVELYDLRADPSECHDLAAAEPARLEAMIDTWWQEADRNQVLPLDNRPFSELVFQRTSSVAPRARYTYEYRHTRIRHRDRNRDCLQPDYHEHPRQRHRYTHQHSLLD
jgi:hypothetical protein